MRKIKLLVACSIVSLPASADPLRLRGDAFAQAQAPVGLLVLQGEDKAAPWVDAEGLAWMGTQNDAATGDVLTLSARFRDPRGAGEARVGRLLVATGAVRPLHMDGAYTLGRTRFGTTAELFGGSPVVPRLGARAYDWAAGGRLAQSVMGRGTVGLAYVQRRDYGRLADEELGVDLAAAPIGTLDVAARAAYDLVTKGPSDLLASLSMRLGDVRVEAFGTQRSPSRLLPATSLFSVFGDVPSTRIGGSVRWRAAPRLDLLAFGAAQHQHVDFGADVTLRAVLRTDDEGRGQLGTEWRRQEVPGARWTGVRGFAVLPLSQVLRASTELELVALHDRVGGGLRPWGLLALTWRPLRSWDVAAAVEALSSNIMRYEVNALVRASYSWERL